MTRKLVTESGEDMTKNIVVATLLLAGLNVTASDDNALWRSQKVKIISLGNDTPPTEYLRNNIELMEAKGPFDGIDIAIQSEGCDRPGEDKLIRYRIFQNWKWEKEWFKKDLENLKATKFKKFTDNFIRLSTLPGEVSWFDDEAWSTICGNYAIMAWLAKEGGLKGIHFDPENYKPVGKCLFQYDPGNKHSFEETYAKARERGRQFIKAMTKEYDNITIFTVLGSLSIEFLALDNPDPMQFLKSDAYGLSVAFFNGMYDALPAQAKIIDGYERDGYWASTPLDYYKMRYKYDVLSKRLLAPENIGKFQTQTSLGVATYLDAYVDETGNWVVKSDTISRLDLFRRNLTLAVKFSDEYTWIWSEQGKWWPIELDPAVQKSTEKKIGKGRLWEEILPGVTAAIKFARDPLAFALSELNEGKLKPVLNINFEPSTKPLETGAPLAEDWKTNKNLFGLNTYQSSKSKGTFTLDKAVGYKSDCSLRLTSVKGGCVLQGIPVKPDEVYFIRESAMSKGNAVPILILSWKNAANKWVNGGDVVRLTFNESLDDNWRRASAVVYVPQGCAFMYFQCFMKSGGEPEDICWFDNIEIYKMY